jgi:ubiquinone/menaquinone biosynthesis C-methylase UbiE
MQPVALEREETLFERCWWFYALCREHLFTDHTADIAAALAPLFATPPSPSSQKRHLLEVGCGPGFYARRFAALYPDLEITGVDLSEPLLSRARREANRSRLHNCRFVQGDAHSLSGLPGKVDAVIASRLFLILSRRLAALEAIYHALRPGGLCFIAEPQSEILSSVPLRLMRLAALPNRSTPVSCRVVSISQLRELLSAQPWQNVRIWRERGYLCAVCEKLA